MSLAIEPGGESVEFSSRQNLEMIADGDVPVTGFASQDETPATSGAVEPVATGGGKTPPQHGLLQAGQSLVKTIVVAMFILTFLVQPFRIPSASMEPTLLVGDFLLVNKQVVPEDSPHIFPPTDVIRRGDVIVFHYPVDSSLHLVKRVIGLPGDRLQMRNGHVYINGTALREPYAMYRPSAPDSYRDEFPRMTSEDPDIDSRWWIQMHSLVSQGELTVPADSYFVLGDNRNDSEDSRYWGFVPRSAIVGKAFLIYFSLNEPDSTTGLTSASAMPESGDERHEGLAASLADFARWDRALHIIN